MSPKIIEGLFFVIGLGVCMYALFNRGSVIPSRVSSETRSGSGKKSAVGGRGAYLLIGSSMIVYGLVELMWRSAS